MTLLQKMRHMGNYMRVGLAVGALSLAFFGCRKELPDQTMYNRYEGKVNGYKVEVTKRDFADKSSWIHVRMEALSKTAKPYCVTGSDFDGNGSLDDMYIWKQYEQFSGKEPSNFNHFRINPGGDVVMPVWDGHIATDITANNVHKAKSLLEEAVQKIVDKEHEVQKELRDKR